MNINGGKTQLLLPDICSKNSGVIDLKIDGSVLDEKLSFKMLLLYSSLSFFLIFLYWKYYVVSIAKTALKKIKPLICSTKFLFLNAV